MKQGTPDALRVGSPICVAPMVAMVFDTYGNVQACCANALFPLGNVQDSTLREIWEGPRAEAMRAALARHDLDFGCGVCHHRLQISSGDIPRDVYDLYPLEDDSTTPEWPALLSFSLHNTCNLECVMCGGDSSSKIRTRRDGLPGLPHVYGEDFFTQLRPFLEHCSNVDFIGGEPFLVREHERVWEMMIDIGRSVSVSVTTNGTTWNDKVERWLDAFDTTVFISIDGTTRGTFEAVRVGASFDGVMANLERFKEYCERRGTQLIVSWSLVRQNWPELAPMMEWAEQRNILVHVQTVLEPEFGVQRLPTPELALVVEAMEQQSELLVSKLVYNREIWEREVGRLRGELDRRISGDRRVMIMEPPDPSNFEHAVQTIEDWYSDNPGGGTGALGKDRVTGRAVTVDDVVDELRRWSPNCPIAHVRFDSMLRVSEWDTDDLAGTPLAVLDPHRGIGLDGLLHGIANSLGASMWVAEEFADRGVLRQVFFFGSAVRDKAGLVVKVVSILRGREVFTIIAADDALMPREEPPQEVAVKVTSGRTVRR